jgi:hypothetical protein
MTKTLYIIKHTHGEWEDCYTADLLIVKDEVVARSVIDLLINFCNQFKEAHTSDPYFWQDTVNWDDEHEVACNQGFMELCCDIGGELFFTSHKVPESLQPFVFAYSNTRHGDGYFHYSHASVYE